jgi:hypothetical protein
VKTNPNQKETDPILLKPSAETEKLFNGTKPQELAEKLLKN